MSAARRRTQAERRAETSARLISATISSLAEDGYARTTTTAICRRAGVSQGGLFGRFKTLQDLMIATAEEITRIQIGTFNEKLTALEGAASIGSILTSLQANTHEPEHRAWIELLVAARTDLGLRDRLHEVVNRYGEVIFQNSDRISAIDRIPPEIRVPLILIVLYHFDGSALIANSFPRQERESEMIRVLASILECYRDSFESGPSDGS